MYPRVREAVRYAAERVPVAVVSGAAREEIVPVLEASGLAPLLAALVAAEDVVAGKPHPEGYLRVLELLGDGVRADEVIVFEDTEVGVAAAKAAGMYCVGITRTLGAERLAAGRRADPRDRPRRGATAAPVTPLVIAHRGASWDLPENTLPAFERAIEVGADFIELDVRARPDGELVVTHDPPRRRTGLPTLEQAVELTRGRIGLMVELKSPSRYRRHDLVPRVLALLDDDAVVVCFQRPALEEVRRLRPGLRTVQHVGFGVSIRGARGAWAAGFRDQRTTARGLAAARRLGLETTVYTVNAPARMRELAALGVTGIFTDRPELALLALRPG